ncbi:MAG TPA: sugar phosphate isomerase/epimerase family protein [Ktedonobacteraceae bacterium]|nr:sugar phosphate isomerase/epimerase family protein [Ktedonobacteraceae bacterium]
MKLTYTSLACPDWSIEEAVSAAKNYGYTAIEWRLADGAIIEPDASPDVRCRLREVPAEHGIEVACLDSSCKAVQADETGRQKTIEAGRRMLDMAAEIGAPFLRVFGGEIPANSSRSSLLGPTAEVLHTLGSYGAQRNVTVILETHDAWTNSEDVRALWKAVDLPTFKVLWDTHHTYRFGESPSHTLALLGDAIAYAHIKDSLLHPSNSEAWTYCLLGEGDVPLHKICETLKGGGYTGYLSLEWEKKWHPEITEPEIALPQAVTYLRPLLR